MTLSADLTSPRAVRAQLSRWLSGAHWPDDELDAIVYAVSEAVSNSAEHAYPPAAPGEVTVTAELQDHDSMPDPGGGGTRQVRVTIIDQGTWRIPPASSEGRRRGLQLVAALMYSVAIHHPPPPPDDATSSSGDTRNGSAIRNGSAVRNGTKNGDGSIDGTSRTRIGTTVVLVSARVPL